MSLSNTPNADLEQSLFKAKLKETKLRHRVILTALVPAIVGAVWLIFSISEVTTWHARAQEIEKKEADVQQRELSAQQRIAEADAKRIAAEKRVSIAEEKETAAAERLEDMQDRLVKVRREIGSLVTLLTEVSSAKQKASMLNASYAVETDLSEIRTTLGQSLGRVEETIDAALPATEHKARIYLFVADEPQRMRAKALVPILEQAGYDVAAIAKKPGRRLDNAEVRYFRDPRDKAEAIRIQAMVAAEKGNGDIRVVFNPHPDHTTGSQKFQVWLSKAPPSK
jgi:hypothetical protein